MFGLWPRKFYLFAMLSLLALACFAPCAEGKLLLCESELSPFTSEAQFLFDAAIESNDVSAYGGVSSLSDLADGMSASPKNTPEQHRIAPRKSIASCLSCCPFGVAFTTLPA